jgi:phosphomannomutase/phosphoglucomutase
MNTHIFRQYDIRGIAETDLTDELVEGLGRAYATRARRTLGVDAPVIGVGNDMRLSSKRLLDALGRGLAAAGAQVRQLGLVPTPVVYFAKYELGLDGVIQITGSHNPGEYNGFKMMMGSDTLHGESIQELRALIEAEDYESGDGSVKPEPGILKKYLDWIRDDITLGDRRLSVVLDCGNGVGGVVAEDLVEGVLGQEAHGMFTTPDGNFPNHHPDPTVPKNLEMMCAKVRELGADLGVAYDGDADRIGICDEHGKVIFGDMLLVLLSRALLEEIPGATIIGEVKCSQTLFDDVAKHGGKPIMARVGHSLIKAKIKETNAELAGEMSGHIFYNDRFFGFDDALYTTARLIEILTATDSTVSELLADLPETFATPEIRRDCPEELKFDVPGIVAEHYAEQGFEVNTIDGVRVNFGDGWGLCRASNTQPVVVLRVEATSAERRDELLAGLEAAVQKAEAKLQG